MNILFIKVLLLLVAIQIALCNGVQVKVEQGWLEGEVVALRTGKGQYNSFKGIPYAQCPNGTLRFKAPRPALVWSGVRSAKKHGPICYQKDILTNVIGGSENCLYLNVYSPDLKPKTALSVVVFIHGGGFTSGSGNDDYYGPDPLIRRNMVVVTLNYRLGALGFLTLDTEAVPGNAGMKDQVAALKWVQKNIGKFGGDPKKVTLMGQGAGAASVGLHLRSPMSKGLFNRAVALGGSPTCDWALPFHQVERSFALGKSLDFETHNSRELLQYLQSVSAEDIVKATAHIITSEEYTDNVLKMFQFVPVEEKYYGQNNFLTCDDSENINEVDIMFGHNNQELATVMEPLATTFLNNYNKFQDLWVPAKLAHQLEPNTVLELADTIREFYLGDKQLNRTTIQEFVNYGNDVTFQYDTMKYFLERPSGHNKVKYAYQFSVTSSRNIFGQQGIKYGIKGAARYDDLCYLFDPHVYNLVGTEGSNELQLIDEVTKIFTDFAKYGNPLHSVSSKISWPTSNTSSRAYVDISNTGARVSLNTRSLNDSPRFRFWEDLYSDYEY